MYMDPAVIMSAEVEPQETPCTTTNSATVYTKDQTTHYSKAVTEGKM